MTPDRWRLGTRSPFAVYRVADGAHDVDHAREHFVGSFRREEDARLAVDAVNAQADRVDLDYPAGRWRDVYVRVHGDKEVATTEQVTDTIRIDWSAPDAAGEVDIVGVEVVAATGVEVDDDPAGSAVGQRGAPTRDVLVVQFDDALFYNGPCGASVFRWLDGRFTPADEPMLAGLAERMGDVALAALRDGGADTGGEEEADPCAEDYRGECSMPGHDHSEGRRRTAMWTKPNSRTGQFANVPASPPSGQRTGATRRAETERWLASNDAVPRLARALGVSLDPDDPDPVGRLVEAAEKAREVEVVWGSRARDLPTGTIVWPCDDDGVPDPSFDGEVVRYRNSQQAPNMKYLVLHRPAPAPAPAALAVGEVVDTAAKFTNLPELARLVPCDKEGQPMVDMQVVTPQSYLGDWDAASDDAPFVILTLPSVRVGTGGGKS